MEQKKVKKIILLVLILLAMFILILIALGCLGKIDNKQPIPTGNVDIFDVIFEVGNKQEDKIATNIENADANNEQESDTNNKSMIIGKIKKSKKNNNSNQLGKDNNNSKTSNNESKTNNDNPKPTNGMTVYDDETNWSNWTKLNIFKNTSYFVEDNKIAPASENSYQFVIRNNNDFNIKYDLKLSENNEFNINMRYRLKQNGEYIIGNDNEYVTYDKLNQYNVNLVDNAYDVYTLDWKWVESENDTQIGEQDIDVNYELNLQILAMQV